MVLADSLFVGGWAFSAEALRREEFARDVISIHDLGWESGSDGLVANAADRLQKHISNGKPRILLAWSTGAMIALETASRCPQNICGLVILAGTPSFISREGFKHGTEPAQLRALRMQLKRDRQSALRSFYRTVLRPGSGHESLMEFWMSASVGIPEQSLAAGLHYLETFDARAAATEIRVPTLILHGANDEVVPCAAGAELAGLIPRAKFVEFKGLGHYLFADRRKEVLEAIEEFSTGCRL
ncbi:MAG: alpha/beta fold hydrolase [Bdellovibrionales bacterium]|nr:alpha/beta fold hydrolase [Bdellovibrionales bacterium]